MFIVLEGLDGAGKSTQLKYVEGLLQAYHLKSKLIHFPRFDTPFYGALIAQFLRGELGAADQVPPHMVALIYAGDRLHAAPQMKKWIIEGYVVIADRYVYSNIAYQCAKIEDKKEQEELRNWIMETEYSYFHLPKPDLNLFLDVPLTFVAEKLNENRDGTDRAYLNGKSDIHESNLSLQEKVRQVYLDQARLDDRFKVIPCYGESGVILPPQEISSRICEKLKPIIQSSNN
jgi:dTMP kinase